MDTMESITATVKLPQFKKVRIKTRDLRKRCINLGKEQLARVGDRSDWSVGFLVADYYESGFDQSRGPMPTAETDLTPEELKSAKSGDIVLTHVIGGNRRATALAVAAEEKPDLFADQEIEFHVYSRLTDDQRQYLINREANTTVAFTAWDYYKQSMLRWIARPDEDEVEHLKGMGVERALALWPGCVKEHALVKTDNGIFIKPGFGSSKVWEKGKGGNRTDPVQTGKALSRAHPQVREMFFRGRTDPKKGISYRKVIELNNAWHNSDRNGDADLRPELSTPPAPLDVLADKFPDSKLVQAVAEVEKAIEEAEASKTGGKTELGRMSKKEADGFIQSLNFSRVGVAVLKHEERYPGRRGEKPRALLEKLLKSVESRLTTDEIEILNVLDQLEGAANAANKDRVKGTKGK